MSLTGLKSRCPRGYVFFSRGSRGKSVSLPFPGFIGHLHSLAHGPSPPLKPVIAGQVLAHITLTLTLLPSSFFFFLMQNFFFIFYFF